MTVVYIDCVFCLNAVMDALLLWATGQLAGVPVCGRRCLLAGMLGGAYAAAVFLPGFECLSALLWKLLVGAAMALIVFGVSHRFARQLLLFCGVSCGMAGCVMGIGLLSGGVPMENGVFYTNVDVRVLLTASAAAYAVLTVVFRAAAREGVRGMLVPVVLEWNGRRVALTALCDTGNSLRDPVTGRPMLVAEAAALSQLWPRPLRTILAPAGLRSPAAALGAMGEERTRFRLVPYRAVGVPGGLLLAVRVDRGIVNGKEYERLLVALSPTELGEGYTALWGETERSDVHEWERFGATERETAGDDAESRDSAAAKRSLHRRK